MPTHTQQTPSKLTTGHMQPSRPRKGRGSVAARRRTPQAHKGAGRDKTRGWGPRGTRIRRGATKEFLPGLIGTHRLTHDMSPSDMMQPQEPHTCNRSSALLEALRRQMDPSGRQLAADICHMWSKRSGQAVPAHPHSPWCVFTTSWPYLPPGRTGAASVKRHRPRSPHAERGHPGTSQHNRSQMVVAAIFENHGWADALLCLCVFVFVCYVFYVVLFYSLVFIYDCPFVVFVLCCVCVSFEILLFYCLLLFVVVAFCLCLVIIFLSKTENKC